MNIRNQFILILAVLFTFSLVVKAQTQNTTNEELPKVIKAVAPSEYPSAARITNAQSKIIIEVEINSEGIVKSAKWVKGHKLFREVSEEAAKKWRFDSVENKKTRRVEVIFIYTLVFGENDASEISFNAPYEIELRYKIPNIINPSTKSRNE